MGQWEGLCPFVDISVTVKSINHWSEIKFHSVKGQPGGRVGSTPTTHASQQENPRFKPSLYEGSCWPIGSQVFNGWR